jgi:hypothetical protein
MSRTATFDLDSRATVAVPEQPDAPDASAAGGERTTKRSTALAVRRAFLIASPVLAGVFLTVGAVADPAAGISGDRMLEIYGDNPDPLQFKSLGYHWAYAFWIVPAMLIAPLVRGRGAWLATITAFLGFVGVSTMPGLLLVDWFDSAVVATQGLEGHAAVTEAMAGMWGVPVFIVPGIVALFLALPMTMVTLWRAGLARWWGLAAALGAIAAFVGSNATWPGTVAATVFLGVVSLAFARATDPARGTA